MNRLLLKTAIRSMFALTSRDRAHRQAQRCLAGYLRLAEGLDRKAGTRPVRVPPMAGVDEDMRNWSFYMVLEHNRRVNESISATVGQLVRNEPLHGAAAIDPKTGVVPPSSADENVVRQFQDSVDAHVGLLSTLGPLRGTRTAPHPLFGDFDAHMWNCMFSFHLNIHLRQAAHVARAARTAPARP